MFLVDPIQRQSLRQTSHGANWWESIPPVCTVIFPLLRWLLRIKSRVPMGVPHSYRQTERRNNRSNQNWGSSDRPDDDFHGDSRRNRYWGATTIRQVYDRTDNVGKFSRSFEVDFTILLVVIIIDNLLD